MSSPNKVKKRRTNDYQPSKQPVKSLDFFFKGKAAAENYALEAGKAEKSEVFVDESKAPLTDEEYARQLQEEWNKQDEVSTSSAASARTSLNEQASGATPEPQRKSLPKSAPVPSPQAAPTLSLQSVSSTEDDITLNIPFDEHPLTFEPEKYVDQLQASWRSTGDSASYGILTRAFVLINSTTSRIKIVDTLTNLLRTLIVADPDSLISAVWLTTNSISPPYIDLELGLGGSAISKALQKVCGLKPGGLKTLYDKHGDAGDVAFEAKKKQSFTLRRPKPLSITGVYGSLVKIANSKGQGSQEFKQRIVERLLQDTQSAEQSRYLVRTLCQHLRIGAVKTTMLIALSRAFSLSRPPGKEFLIHKKETLAALKKDALVEIYSRAEEIVKASFARRPNYDDLVACLLDIGVGEELLVRCGLGLHIPLRPMLGSITRDLGEMLTKLQGRDFACEFKYDGQRAQVHCDAHGKVSIFSRHLEVMTEKYPDLVALVPQIRSEGVNSFILEGEVVAVDTETGDLKPFQILTNRAKKDVDIGAVKIDVCLFSFDLMFLNGEPLLDRPFRERRNLLKSLFIEIPNRFTWVNSLDANSADSEAVLEFFKAATDIKCEGIMVKVLDNMGNSALITELDEHNGTQNGAPVLPLTPSKRRKTAAEKIEEKEKGTRRKALLSTYEPDKRLDSWLKVKKDYNTSADTLDLIPIAGWHGQGRKSKWWSPILLAVRNPDTGSLEAVTKCISGFTDKFYIANKEKYSEGGQNVISKPAYVESSSHPDVWFEPQEVWEMAFADITLSPVYTAAIGLVSDERGLSMRFPRFLKVREDKSIEEASTAEFLANLYRKQESRKPADGILNEGMAIEEDE